MRCGPKTAAADLAVKLKQARSFIEKGYRVKAAVPFRMSERAAAHDMLHRLRIWPPSSRPLLTRRSMSGLHATLWPSTSRRRRAGSAIESLPEWASHVLAATQCRCLGISGNDLSASGAPVVMISSLLTHPSTFKETRGHNQPHMESALCEAGVHNIV